MLKTANQTSRMENRTHTFDRCGTVTATSLLRFSESCSTKVFEKKHPFADKQLQIAERKRMGEQGAGDRSKEAA
jgi:hypothetical protein